MGSDPNINEWQCLASYLEAAGENDADSLARELQLVWEWIVLSKERPHFSVDRGWEEFQRRRKRKENS